MNKIYKCKIHMINVKIFQFECSSKQHFIKTKNLKKKKSKKNINILKKFQNINKFDNM